MPRILRMQKLSFKKDGAFKIVQFTDMHYVDGNQKSDTTLRNYTVQGFVSGRVYQSREIVFP